jgi:hypothetical protein
MQLSNHLKMNRTNWRFVWPTLILVPLLTISACSASSVGLAAAAGAQETLVVEALSATPASSANITPTPMPTPVVEAALQPSQEPIFTEIPAPKGLHRNYVFDFERVPTF